MHCIIYHFLSPSNALRHLSFLSPKESEFEFFCRKIQLQPQIPFVIACGTQFSRSAIGHAKALAIGTQVNYCK